jgi:hypothetical protein
MQQKNEGAWLARYIQDYSRQKTDNEQLLLVTYSFPRKPNRMFYYRLEHLLTAVNGRRAQKSVIIVPENALPLIESLCGQYKGRVFSARFGEEPSGD